MALPPQPMGSIVDSGLMQGGPQEEMLGQQVEVMAPEEFEGGAEVIPDGEGGAIVQAIAALRNQARRTRQDDMQSAANPIGGPDTVQLGST